MRLIIKCKTLYTDTYTNPHLDTYTQTDLNREKYYVLILED